MAIAEFTGRFWDSSTVEGFGGELQLDNQITSGR
jgi:hypothetical protein